MVQMIVILIKITPFITSASLMHTQYTQYIALLIKKIHFRILSSCCVLLTGQ